MSPPRERSSLGIVTSSLLTASLFLIPLGAAGTEPVRVALVGSHVGEVAGGAVALAEARLSGRKGLDVLDRHNVKRMLQEQQLSVAGLVDASFAMKVGQVCSVDLFALVEQSTDGEETLACIVYDSATGVRLCDESLPSDEIEASADAVVACVDFAARKRSAGLGKLQPLTVIGVRNADLPRSLDTQCQSLAMLLERGLIRSGNIALLERTRLAWLQQEQNLATAPRDKQLLSSILQADLEFSRHADGVRATLIITDAAGHHVHKATSDAKQLDVALLTPLMEGLARSLDTKLDAVHADRPREARRYFREAALRWSYGDMPGAIQSAEAALLLDPDDPDKKILLAEYLFGHGHSESVLVTRPDLRSPARKVIADRLAEYRRIAAIGERAIDLMIVAFRQAAPDSAEALSKYNVRTHLAQGNCSNLFQWLPRVETLDQAHRPEWHRLQSELFEHALQMPRDRLNAWRDLVRETPAAFSGYSSALGSELSHLWTRRPEAEAATAAATEFVNGWLEEFDHLPLGNRPHQSVGNALNDVTGHIALRPEYGSHLKPLLDRLARHPDPVIQVHGRRGLLFASWTVRPALESDVVLQFRPICQDVIQRLAQPDENTRSPTRLALYDFLNQSFIYLSLRDGSPELVAELRDICEPMLARRELHVRLVENWARSNSKCDLDGARVGLAVIDKALELCQSSRYILVGSVDSQLIRPQLVKWRADLLARWPELRKDEGPWHVQTKALLDLAKVREQDALLTHPLVRNDTVYAVILSRSASRGNPDALNVKVVSVPLAGGPPTFLDSIDITATAGGSYEFGRVVTGRCLHDQRLYVATRGGIVEFDLQTNASRMVPASPSFPTQVAQSVASFADRLFAGLEGGYLVSFSPDDDACQMLASSRRKQPQSPLDDREAFDLPNLFADPERERILLHVTNGNVHGGKGEIWEYRPGADQYRRVVEFSHSPGSVSNVQQGRMIVSNGPFVSLALDLATDRRSPASSLPHGLRATPCLAQSVQCAGRIWTTQGQSLTGKLGTVAVDKADEQVVLVDLPPLDKSEIYAGWYVAPVDDHRFLWSNHHRLWLVTPQAATSEAATATEGASH